MKKKDTKFQYGDNVAVLPRKAIKPWHGEVAAAYTGPSAGFTRLSLTDKSTAPDQVLDHAWNRPNEYAYGISLSLYDEDKKKMERIAKTEGASSAYPAKYYLSGDPVADVFGIVVRENYCVMAVADGVSWGAKSRLAARCATYGVMEHFSRNMGLVSQTPNSSTVSRILHESVTEKAQQLIVDRGGTLTTLSAAVVCETETPGEWGLFVCAVGDSPVYVYCPHTMQVMEVTVGCHNEEGRRNIRLSGGVLGQNPDWGNLTYAYTPVYPGDIVFAVTDGVSDNLSDKVMGSLQDSSLKACCDAIPHLKDLLSGHQASLSENFSAQTLVACLINHAVEVTDRKRCAMSSLSLHDRKGSEAIAKVKAIPGKLDHATVVAFQVGRHYPTKDRS